MMNAHLKVLIVEDNPAYVRLAHELLKEYKLVAFDLISAESLSAALALIKANPIDIILLDLGLPDSKGIETFREINKIAINIPIIIITGLEDEQIAFSTISEGAQDYLVKGTFEGYLLARAMLYAIERKQNEAIISENASIIENANEAVISLTPDGLVKNLNNAAQVLFNYSANDMIGKSFFVLVPEEDKNTVNQMLQLVQSGGNVVQHEFSLKDRGNKLVNCAVNASPIKNKIGTIIGTALMMQDITQRKQSELRSAIQLRVSTILAELNNLQNVTQGILKIICEILDFKIGEVWALDSENNVLILASSWSAFRLPIDFLQESHDINIHLGEDTPGYVWLTKRPYWSTNLDKESNIIRTKLLTQNNLHCELGIPIIFGEDILGVLIFFGHNLTQPDISMIILFEVIGKQIGTFLKRKRLENDLLHLANYDYLTGLANKFTAETVLSNAIALAKKNQTIVAFLYLDLDHFKNINDILGHSKGDWVLQEVAHRLKKVTRESDLIARFSGDEFALVIPGIKTRARVSFIAKKIIDIIALPYVINEKEFYLTASIGISIYPYDGSDVNSLLIAADIALYKVKQAGRNGYQYSSKENWDIEQKKLLLENRLHQALENNEFVLYYQPIVNVQTNKIEGAEALIRWKNLEGEVVGPDEFVSLLEQSYLILRVGEWVLRTACQQFKMCQKFGLKSVSVNVSIHQLSYKFVELVKSILDETDVKPENLIIEVTESMLMQETELMIAILNALKEIGVSTSIDDFGTGYSSFSYLQSYGFYNLKIDKSFITNVNENKTAGSIVKAIVAMTKILDLTTTAEGVETREQLEFLKEAGCDQYQGFYFSKPIPVSQLISLLKLEAGRR